MVKLIVESLLKYHNFVGSISQLFGYNIMLDDALERPLHALKCILASKHLRFMQHYVMAGLHLSFPNPLAHISVITK